MWAGQHMGLEKTCRFCDDFIPSFTREHEISKDRQPITLPETNSEFTPENAWLEDEFPFGMAFF